MDPKLRHATRRTNRLDEWWRAFRQRPTWKLDLILGIAIGLIVVVGGITVHLIWQWWTSPLNPYPTPGAAPKAAETLQPDFTAVAALPTALPNAPLPAQPWDGHSRVNLLLLGVDDRVWDPNWGAPRADTIILLTLDPATRSAGALSIPRDLFVEVPGFGMHKINTAYSIGEANLGAWGGVTLTVRTVERLLDVEIPYFAVVDFRAFITFIDAIDGVKVDLPEDILVGIETQNGRRMIHLRPGVQTLSGSLALAYARNRAKPIQGLDGDFGRMYRQQIILRGVLNRLKEPHTWAALTLQAPFLYRELTQSLRTNVRPQDALAWGRLAAELPKERLVFAEIGHQETVADMVNGMYILRPLPDRIAELKARLFAVPSATATPSPAPSASPSPAMPTVILSPTPISPTPTPSLPAALEEGATLALTNATLTPHLACRTAAALHTLGFQVVSIDDSNTLRDETLLEVYADRPATFAYLVAWLGFDPVRDAYRIRFMPVGSGPADFRVVLGSDWAVARSASLPEECYHP